jgi:hypothetical protein
MHHNGAPPQTNWLLKVPAAHLRCTKCSIMERLSPVTSHILHGMQDKLSKSPIWAQIGEISCILCNIFASATPNGAYILHFVQRSSAGRGRQEPPSPLYCTPCIIMALLHKQTGYLKYPPRAYVARNTA